MRTAKEFLKTRTLRTHAAQWKTSRPRTHFVTNLGNSVENVAIESLEPVERKLPLQNSFFGVGCADGFMIAAPTLDVKGSPSTDHALETRLGDRVLHMVSTLEISA